MAHQINSMAYAGAMPWHKLGTFVGDQDVSAGDMIKAAGMDWNVRKLAPEMGVERDEHGRITEQWHVKPLDHVLLVRSDTFEVLGTAKSGYETFGNQELFAFLDSFRSEGLKFHTAGALFNGERVWALAQVDGQVMLRRADGSGDPLASYLLCTAGHDGANAIVLQPTSVRVVCFNTLSAAIGEKRADRFSVKHTASLPDKLNKARAALTGAVDHVREFARVGGELDRARMADREFVSFALATILNIEASSAAEADQEVAARLADATDRIKARTENAVSDLMQCFKRGIGNAGESRYDALNAVTEWIDHQRGRAAKGRQTAEQLSRAADSAWNGTGADRKARAVRMLTSW